MTVPDAAATPQGSPRTWTDLRLQVGGIVALVLLLLGFVSVIWTPYPVGHPDVTAQLQDPGAMHWLGTDQLGRDLFSMLMAGTLTSFVVAGIAVLIGLLIGAPLGLASATLPGSLGNALDRIGGFLSAFPALLLAMLFAAATAPGTLTAMVAIGLCTVPAFAGTARDGMRTAQRLDYVAAAHLSGMDGWSVFRKHVLPGFAMLLMAQAAAQMAMGVLAEASLSFLGLGVQPPAASLGLLLRDAQSFVLTKPLLIWAPGLVIVILVVTLGMVSSGLASRQATEAVRGAA